MISEKQQQVIYELVKGVKTKQQIADEYNITSRTIKNWLQNDEFQQQYKKDMEAIMAEASAEALKTIVSLMRNAESENVRMNCAKDILSRAGYDATAKNKVDLATPEKIVLNIE